MDRMTWQDVKTGMLGVIIKDWSCVPVRQYNRATIYLLQYSTRTVRYLLFVTLSTVPTSTNCYIE